MAGMTIKYFAHRYRDSFAMLDAALQDAGFISVADVAEADVLFLDHENRLKKMPDKPLFIYPHTPYAYWLWDGIVTPQPAACNFVVADGAKAGMERYGYPYRVEVIGFNRCAVLPFQPTTGKDVLFAPAHPFGNKRFPRPNDHLTHINAMQFISEHRNCFGRVVVRYASDLSAYHFEAFTGAGIEFVAAEELSVRSSLQAMEPFDLVISQGTFGYLALASGKPTVLYGYENNIPGGRQGDVRHYELYRDVFDFPLPLECLTIEDVLGLRLVPQPTIKQWKILNIGGNFDQERFVSIVRECL